MAGIGDRLMFFFPFDSMELFYVLAAECASAAAGGLLSSTDAPTKHLRLLAMHALVAIPSLPHSGSWCP